jgi:hypothetical protein
MQFRACAPRGAPFWKWHAKGLELKTNCMNAIIFYEDLAVALEAKGTFQRAAFRADQTLGWNLRPWRLDLLRLPPVAKTVLTEALDASVLLFCLRPPFCLEPFVYEWLERLAAGGALGETGLVVFRSGKDGSGWDTATPALRHFAETHGLDFIQSAPDSTDDSFDFWRKHAYTSIATEQIREGTFHCRHGINE